MQHQLLIVPVTYTRVDFHVIMAPVGRRSEQDLLDLLAADSNSESIICSEESEPSIDIDDVVVQPLRPGVTVSVTTPPQHAPLPSFSLPTPAVEQLLEARVAYYQHIKDYPSPPSLYTEYIQALENYIRVLERSK